MSVAQHGNSLALQRFLIGPPPIVSGSKLFEPKIFGIVSEFLGIQGPGEIPFNCRSDEFAFVPNECLSSTLIQENCHTIMTGPEYSLVIVFTFSFGLSVHKKSILEILGGAIVRNKSNPLIPRKMWFNTVVHNEERVFGLSNVKNQILTFDREMKTHFFVCHVDNPNRMAIFENELFVTSDFDRITVFSVLDGKRLRTFRMSNANFQGLVVHPITRELIVVDQHSNSVLFFSLDGQILRTFGELGTDFVTVGTDEIFRVIEGPKTMKIESEEDEKGSNNEENEETEETEETEESEEEDDDEKKKEEEYFNLINPSEVHLHPITNRIYILDTDQERIVVLPAEYSKVKKKRAK